MSCEPRILKFIYPSVTINTASPDIHLTFDDGPHPEATPAVLKILNERNIRATFFFLGQNAQQYPDIAKQVVSEGHKIGNHSFSHTNMFFRNKAFIREQIRRTNDIFESALGIKSVFFRPPYGHLNYNILNVLQEFGMTCVLWNIDSKDYRLEDQNKIEKRIFKKISGGSILLFHDNHYTAPKIHKYLPDTLDKILENKFDFRQFES